MAFRDIVGHRRQLGLLARAVAAGTLPPSLVFSGPEGVGKRQVAMALAQALNCLKPVDDAGRGWRDACGSCAACSKIARRSHPDLLIVEPGDSGSIRIETLRDLLGQMAYRPYEGRYRLVIIDGADQMTTDAQDAMLKTLEEPPARTVLVLVAVQPSDLLPTIRSRCCHVRFAPLASQDIAAALVERHRMSDRDAHAAAALSGGSFRRALDASTIDTVEARAVALAILQGAARAGDPRARLALGSALLEAVPGKSKGKTQSGAARDALAVRLGVMASLLRDVSVLSARASETALVNLDLRPDLERLAREYDRARLERAFSAVGRSLAAVERQNASPKIVVDWLAFQL